MSAYIIVRANVQDKEKYQAYASRSPAAVEAFGGKYIARGGETVTLEGPEEARRLVIIEFPTLEKAKAFYASEEYQFAKQFREGAGDAEFVIVDGYSG